MKLHTVPSRTFSHLMKPSPLSRAKFHILPGKEFKMLRNFTLGRKESVKAVGLIRAIRFRSVCASGYQSIAGFDRTFLCFCAHCSAGQ